MSSSFAKGSRRAAAAVSRSRTNLTKTQAVEAFLAKAAQPLRKSNNNNNNSSSSSNTRRFNHEESTTPERRRGANATPKGKYHKGRDASRGIEFHKGFNTTSKSHHQNTTSSANLRTPSILHHSSSSSAMSSACSNRLFVSCIKGLEPLLEAELKELGFEDTNQAYSGVYVNINNNNNSNKSEDSSDSLMRAIYKLNYQSRIATRVLLPLQQVQCNNRDELYNAVYDSIDWRKYVPRGKTFAIDSNLIKTHTSLNHSLFAAQVMKDGIVDQYRKRTDNSYRPTVSVQNPDVQLNLFITKTSLLNNMNNNNSTNNNNNNNNNTESARENRDTREDNNDFTAMISLDTSRTPLFKRGYRVANVAAPLQEHLAAAILRIADLENRVAEFQKTSGGEKDFTFCDPFCGSGTFLAEAAMILKRVPPGYIRGAHPDAYGFSHLEQFDEDAYRKCKEEADAQMLPQLQGVRFIGIDKDAEALKATKQNLLRSGLFKQADKYGRMENVELVHSDFRNYMTRSILMNAAAINATTSVMDDTLTNRFINLMVTNPPYGVRIGDNRGGGDEEDLKQLYGKIGDFMKKLCAVNSKGFVITWSPDLAKSVGLKTTRRHILYNGGMETRLLEYNLY